MIKVEPVIKWWCLCEGAEQFYFDEPDSCPWMNCEKKLKKRLTWICPECHPDHHAFYSKEVYEAHWLWPEVHP